MAWEISITREGWQEIRDQLDDPNQWPKDSLIKALVDDFVEAREEQGKAYSERLTKQKRKQLEKLPCDILADACFELIESNNACDNGGYGYWIDRQGYHKVWLSDEPYAWRQE